MSSKTARLLAALTFASGIAPSPVVAQPTAADVTVFANVPSPGAPEGIAVTRGGGVVYVGTNRATTDATPHPAVIFAFDPNGVLIDQWDVQGQNPNTSGVLGLALDAAGALYMCDGDQDRIARLFPNTGEQNTYATFHDVPPCVLPWSFGDDCSAGDSDDSAPTPNYLVFAEDGTLYVTDSSQGLIWRVPPGGGAGEVWFTDPSFDGVFGPNGIQFRADGTTLVLAMTGYQGPDDGFATGRLHELDVQQPSGDPGTLTPLWESTPADGPDGISITASGDVFTPLAGTNAVARVLANGSEDYRLPANPTEAALISPPMDMPASTGFLGDRLLMTNQSLFAGNPTSYVVYDIDVGETGLALFYPLPEPGALPSLATGAMLLAGLGHRRRG